MLCDKTNMIATIEAGLPGTGPLPIHLHTGRPTPWSEGCVVRFNPDADNEWIANIQTGYGYSTKLIEWPDANAIVVIAKGAAYIVRPNAPDDWNFIDLLGINCVITMAGDIAILTTYTDVVTILPNGNERWRRSVAIDGVQLESVDNELIHGSAGIEPPDEWHPFTLSLETGKDV